MSLGKSFPKPVRIGAVNYLNTKPLVYGLDTNDGRIELSFDLPSRLADDLASGHLDVALVPVITLFDQPQYKIVSDACIACRGGVRSVKLFFRTPPHDVRTLALDEGSRTSIALAQILLRRVCPNVLELTSLRIGAGLNATDADAVLLIGDRAMSETSDEFAEVWDLGERWCKTEKLPFVFAVWAARRGVDTSWLADALADSRDDGMRDIRQIARRESRHLQMDEAVCLSYLSKNLHFTLGPHEQQAINRFRRYVEHLPPHKLEAQASGSALCTANA